MCEKLAKNLKQTFEDMGVSELSQDLIMITFTSILLSYYQSHQVKFSNIISYFIKDDSYNVTKCHMQQLRTSSQIVSIHNSGHFDLVEFAQNKNNYLLNYAKQNEIKRV